MSYYVDHPENLPKKVQRLYAYFHSEFSPGKFPNCIQVDKNGLNPHHNLIFLDEILASSSMSWFDGEEGKKIDHYDEIKEAERVVNNYLPEDEEDREVIEYMKEYLEKQKQLNEVYRSVWADDFDLSILDCDLDQLEFPKKPKQSNQWFTKSKLLILLLIIALTIISFRRL